MKLNCYVWAPAEFLGTQKCVTKGQLVALSDWYPYHCVICIELLTQSALGGIDTWVTQTTQTKGAVIQKSQFHKTLNLFIWGFTSLSTLYRSYHDV